MRFVRNVSIPCELSAMGGIAGMAKDPSFRQSGLTGEVNPLPILKDCAGACVVARSFFSRGEERRAALSLAWARVIRAAGRLFFPWGGKRRSAAFLLRGETAAPCNPTGVLSSERRPAAFFRGDWVMGVAGRLLQWVCSGLPHRSNLKRTFSKSSTSAGKLGRPCPGFSFFSTVP
jgi:hypothetical protein